MSNWRIIGVSCLILSFLVLGCTNGEKPVTQARDDAPDEVSAPEAKVAQDLVGTWESQFDFDEVKGFKGAMEGMGDMEGMEFMVGMMEMVKGMSETYVLNSDGTFVKTTTMSGKGMLDGAEMVAEGKWSSSDDQVNFYVTRMTSSMAGQEPMVQDFAGATTMPPMAMKLADDRMTFTMAAMPGMGGDDFDPTEIGFYYQKQVADD